ncbi:MAG: hypothetical protein PF445_04805, partial [Melioribacteraceae bacterium]|nr:hypothetical protein [Melioribacteraceae bacterium]
KMKIAGETPFETDLNVWMQLEKELSKDNKPIQTNVAYILKDRSDSINGKSYSFPKYRNFRPIIRFIQGLPIGDIAKESEHQNLTPGSDKDYFEWKQNQKIELEKIHAIFDLNGLGSPRSADDKKYKTLIIQKIFGTTSNTEIEKLDAPKLSFKRDELKELFEELKGSDNPIETIENYGKDCAA